jgi:hypothetical protein
MFCPRCSQEQLSSEQRFCSRCGFPLEDVLEALSNEGYVDRNTGERLNGLRLRVSIGAAVLTLSLVFLIVSLVLGTPEPSFVIQLNLLVTIIVFLLGLSWIGYSLWQGAGTESRRPREARSTKVDHLADPVTAQLDEGVRPALPESYAAPSGVGRARDLAGSVTDSTTKLLDRDR